MGATKINTRNVGVDTEQRTARYFRDEGWAGAERRVRTGYRTAGRTVADQGDLTGMPGICVQVKSLRPHTAAELAVPRWLAETEAQREASGASLGLLVVRRWGTTDVGRWWCFVTASTFLGLADGFSGHALQSQAPVRLELRDVVAMLRGWGWVPDLEATA